MAHRAVFNSFSSHEKRKHSGWTKARGLAYAGHLTHPHKPVLLGGPQRKRVVDTHAHTHAHFRRPARARRTRASPRGRSSVYKSITTSPRVVSRRTAMAPASPQEQTPGNDRRSPRAAAPYVTTCATLVASSAGAVAPPGSATSGSC